MNPSPKKPATSTAAPVVGSEPMAVALAHALVPFGSSVLTQAVPLRSNTNAPKQHTPVNPATAEPSKLMSNALPGAPRISRPLAGWKYEAPGGPLRPATSPLSLMP